MYLDLLPRGGKFQGAAHFVLRSGRRNGDGTYEASGGSDAPEPDCADAGPNLSRASLCLFPWPGLIAPLQLPKVALVCNFGGNMLMHSEVETFLHEMVR